MKRVAAVDFLKGFSIFTIVLMHTMHRMSALPAKIYKLSMVGGTGVHVFFLCSGMGLYLSYLNKRTGYMEFLKKRFVKIYVPYILVVLVSFCLPWMYEGDDRVMALLSHVFLFKMFVPRYESSFGTQFWFMSTLIQFYLVFIPMCILKEKINDNRKFFGIFMFVSVIWWIVCYALGVSDERVWSSFFLQYIWEFALGMVLAEMLRNGGGGIELAILL